MDGEDIDAEHSIKVHRSDAANKKLAQNVVINGKTHATTAASEEIAEAFIASQQEDAQAQQFPEDMSLLQCFWMVTKMAVPLVIGMLLYLLVQLANTYFVGNLNEPALLAGVGMGNMLINVLCFAVV
jgi:hypothetical protein|mmetsp:Transcript_5748/g.7758  ORF Transcript_5748/g.7758 Transcript_5748/m.7758 type:complete len:127 (-) Transcript_5748:1417-1797(-)|eukprot:CAMPEP_0185578880 /NCGR_PEP_ID=MMETSP0434-20130131/13199_1 /TAXON_ID=626734 ORGANISM="Favella taraikaensis, Strain Fe Narragansett Bay" /NCGR_SAMPLE_ID=MMETSP0434 /ASSEMBLY_ACC=CAM_ASM_000379 /LENGTH=126 /DNA_ID=CAMNT_0028196777 /DNA_START=139 /DNA_END=519 /DNA_ORIENTATION=-